jgi:hypothetical protein
MYRRKAVKAKNRAAQASNPHIKSAFKEVARGWLVLAEQMEWMDSQAKPRSTGRVVTVRQFTQVYSFTGDPQVMTSINRRALVTLFRLLTRS